MKASYIIPFIGLAVLGLVACSEPAPSLESLTQRCVSKWSEAMSRMPSRDALPAENTCACFAEALSLEDLAFVMPLIERRVMYPGPSADEAYQTFLHEHLTQQRGPDDSYDDMLDRLTRVENQISSACSPSGGRFDLHD